LELENENKILRERVYEAERLTEEHKEYVKSAKGIVRS